MKTMIKCLLLTFLFSFTKLYAQVQGENIWVDFPSTDKNEIFNIESKTGTKTKKTFKVFEFYGITGNGKKMLAITFDQKLFEQSKKTESFDKASLLLIGPIIDVAREAELLRDVEELFKTSEKVLKDSIRYYESKPQDVPKSTRKDRINKLNEILSDARKENSENLEYYREILEARNKGNTIVVYNHAFVEKPKQVKK